MPHLTLIFRFIAAACLLGILSCQNQGERESFVYSRSSAEATVTSNALRQHISVLASDRFEGRAPGTRGEELTVAYLVNEFKKMGLEPGNPDGSYFQPVPLSGFISRPEVSYRIGGRTTTLAFPQECVVWSRRALPQVQVDDSEMVFVGYGTVAPEYDWDDYKDVDVKGKTLVMLINDPPVPDRQDPTHLDEKMFKGTAMTYYGRWTYKYEIATAKGAAAALIIHETGPAGYPYFVVVGSNSRENFDLRRSDRNLSRVAAEGWIPFEQAERLLGAAGQSLRALKQAASRRDFRPVSLGATASFKITNQLREVTSQNVAAALRGVDARLRDEWVIYTAHWDHLGRDSRLEGDQIYNGALDNASGTAALLELARSFGAVHPRPKRSVLFLSVTAEEKGLLGAQYYVAHPLRPLLQTVANINMDTINPWGKTRDVQVVGYGNTTLEDLLSTSALRQGRVVVGDTEPDKGRFFRSDHFEFARAGVPVLYLKAGSQFSGHAPDYGKAKSAEYTERDYHKVSDEIKADWDLSGGVQDIQLLFQVGLAVSDGAEKPRWKPGASFRPADTQFHH